MQVLKPFILLTALLFVQNGNAQLSPPGLGSTNTAFWGAVGVKQKLDDKNTSVSYVGLGRISGTESDANPFKNRSILVLNQEVYHTVTKHFKYSYALSYRRQNHYEPNLPNIQQEVRAYGRISHLAMVGTVKWKNTLRQEVRKFYTPNFDNVPDGMQLRSRFKTQVSIPLDTDAQNTLITSAEALFSVTHETNGGWDAFSYKESRFCLYYQYAPQSLPITFDVGYMNDLMGNRHHVKDASYLALDIILENVF